MAAKSIKTDSNVYRRLQTEYQEQCGRSPSALIDKLNAEYKEEVDSIRSRSKASSRRDLISDKTLRNYFNASADDPQSLTEKNLNYLCGALLGCESYQEAKIRSLPIDDRSQLWLRLYYDYLRNKHGTVRIPKMTHPMELSAVYTESMFSEELQFRKNKSIVELQAEMELGDIPDRSRVAVSQIFAQYPRLMVWGPAGSGKTTALRALILNAISQLDKDEGVLEHIPVLVELRQFLRLDDGVSFMNAIVSELMHGESNSTLSEDATRKLVRKRAFSLLKEGKLLLLLDGLDEVPKTILSHVQKDMSNFISSYPGNHFVVTCRYGATEFVPSNFKEVEITTFDKEQIQCFVKAWFQNVSESGLSERFLLHLSENSQVQELAENPLMLTMLCSMYEYGRGFPKGEGALFDEATELYLRNWDSYRRIEHRDDIYEGKLSRNRRRNLFSKLAFEGLAKNDEPQFFWKRSALEIFIKQFIQNLPDVEEDSIDTDARAIINALESQDSLLTRSSVDAYTFSYRSFQEYLAAMRIVEDASADAKDRKSVV